MGQELWIHIVRIKTDYHSLWFDHIQLARELVVVVSAYSSTVGQTSSAIVFNKTKKIKKVGFIKNSFSQ